MSVKKNFKLWLAVFAMALPLLFVGTASAKYMSDGAVADPTGTAGFITPNDMMCIVGVHTDGTLDIADGVTSARDCIYLQTGTMNGGTAFDLTGMTTSAACTTANGAGNDGAKHSWATTFCTKSLTGLDRTQKMCEGIGGTWVTTGKCVAYGRAFKGQNASGTPLTIGTKGQTAKGFCYAAMTTGIASADCPSVVGSANGTKTATSTQAFGYTATATACNNTFGVKGALSAALTKADGTSNAIGTVMDLTAITTQGDCLAQGAKWEPWVPAGIAAIPSITGATATVMTFDLTRQAVDADEGCLHCHSTKTEYNGPAERFKDSYLKTGHKNMLRKVTAGQMLVGPDGIAYTTDGTNTINFTNATVNVAGTDRTLYYVYGDWMAALPTLVYSNLTGTTNGYTCGACHTTGYKDNSNPGVLSIGTSGYTPAEPEASFPGINLGTANPKWDLEGITCGRCHNATVPSVTAAQIAASSFPTTMETKGGMGNVPGGPAGAWVNNLCFGCHQSIAKNWPAQGGAAGGTTQYDPTLIPTGISHGQAVGRDFNGHVLGNSFLNSVHARYAGAQSGNGSIKLNSLGKFDLTDTSGTTEYNSTFKGYMCWQSSSSSSPAKTKADGTEIKDKATCEGLYGAGAWRPDTQGNCSTCHDIHNSLFVAEQAEAATRKTCKACHEDNATTGATVPTAPQIAMFNHPKSAGTPFDATMYEDSCAVCHMALQAQKNGDQNSMPVHVWRINTNASYNTFPTADQWNGTNGATKDRNAQVAPETYVKADGTIGTYANAVWVDLDLACGQCHGGSLGAGATHNNALYLDKSQLSSLAKNMHALNPTAGFTWSNDPSTSYAINFDASAACPTGSTCTYAWDFGDTTAGTGATPSHTYADATAKTVTLTMALNGATDSASQPVLPKVVAVPVVVNAPTVSINGLTATVTDNSSGGNDPITVLVNWGDGTSDLANGHGAILTHSYATAKTYAAKITVSGSTGSAYTNFNIVVTPLTVSGLVSSLTGTPLSGAFVTLKVGTVGKYIVVTNALGQYNVPNVAAATYTVLPSKSGYVFAPATVTVTNVNMTANFSATNK